jgi:MoxR-like ATPase
LYIPFPDAALESRILATQVEGLDTQLREQIVALIGKLRDMPLKKSPAVSETIDWARALLLLNVEELDPHWVKETLNLLLKFQDDIELVEPEISALLKSLR